MLRHFTLTLDEYRQELQRANDAQYRRLLTNTLVDAKVARITMECDGIIHDYAPRTRRIVQRYCRLV